MSDTLHVAIDATATPLELTGAGYYVRELVRTLNTHDDIELTIVTRIDDGERFASFAPRARIVDTAPSYKLRRVAFQSFSLGSVVDSLGVDVFHGPHYQLPFRIETPCVATIHDMTLITHKEVHMRAKRIAFGKIIPRSIKRASSIVAVSNHTAHDISELYGHKESIFVAPLGIDRSRFSPHVQDDKIILETRGISAPYIAYLGLLEPRKNLSCLIAAFSRIADDYPDHKLVLAGGDGWKMSELRKAIAESGYATRIVLPGRLSNDEVAPFMRNAQAFVYPSVYEGFGMPVAEAMACGVPTITTDSSSLREVAGNGATLVQPNDAEDLARVLDDVLGDEKLRKEMSASAIARADDFSWTTCTNIHIDAYRAAALL